MNTTGAIKSAFFINKLVLSDESRKHSPQGNAPAVISQAGLFILFIFFLLLFPLTHSFGAEVSHFQPKEFACHHCGKVHINPKLIPMLENLRFSLGNKPIIITSGYRCPLHNREVDGAKHSQHLQGRAVDIKVKGIFPKEVARVAKNVGFTWTKTYSGWTHIDIREIKLAKAK